MRFCNGSDAIERIDRIKHQVEMIARCAHRISCTSETLGAVHQERRVSRAVTFVDKYLQGLRQRCQRLTDELTETK